MERDEIRSKIYSKVDELPTLPAVIPKLLGLIEDKTSGAADVKKAISNDPALTSKILKIANSAYYGFPQEISDLERAVALLGFNMVKSLALSIGVIRSLPSGKKAAHFSWEGLWIHSLAVATMMKALGKRFHKDNDQEYLFIIGLLHDIGKVVLNHFFSDLYQQALDETHDRGKADLFSAERRIIGLDHGEVGAELLRRWKFPEHIINPVAVHHQKTAPRGTEKRDVAMLRIADIIPQQMGIGEEGNPSPPDFFKGDILLLGIQEKEIENLKSHLEGAKDGVYAFFSAMT